MLSGPSTWACGIQSKLIAKPISQQCSLKFGAEGIQHDRKCCLIYSLNRNENRVTNAMETPQNLIPYDQIMRGEKLLGSWRGCSERYHGDHKQLLFHMIRLRGIKSFAVLAGMFRTLFERTQIILIPYVQIVWHTKYLSSWRGCSEHYHGDSKQVLFHTIRSRGIEIVWHLYSVRL